MRPKYNFPMSNTAILSAVELLLNIEDAKAEVSMLFLVLQSILLMLGIDTDSNNKFSAKKTT